jgi:predicted ATPase/signal transduction histidine kinase
MDSIIGYKIVEKIYEDVKTVVYRCQSNRNNSVIIKILKLDYPNLKDLAKFKHEYEIIKHLDLPNVIKAYGLEKYNNSLAFILEDFGGKPLSQAVKFGNLELVDFIKLAIKLAEILGQIHQSNIIHKDIKPQNIILNVETGELKITDFSIASLLNSENQTVSNPNLLEGTLAYMSPEQTGRMNRNIDYRTDFYSLGITFYEMLLGERPFPTTDPIELVHCHIAKQPVPLHKVNPQIPKVVSDLVMKLLAKNAEDRYQNAYGIKMDLQTCLTQLQANDKIDSFILGQNDRAAKFQISQKLYGREWEIETLIAAFKRVSQGTTEIVLIAGYSGLGKSALVSEIHKPIVQQRGYFVSGKFDQAKRNIPYVSLIQAFQELIRQLLTESEVEIKRWKEKILSAVGSNGQVIIDVIPEIELLIGKQASVIQLEPAESENRFNLVFQKFITVFTKKEHPLVIFLDDLQWTDSASLKLLQRLITSDNSQYFLVVGAYRDNEISSIHPLIRILDEIKKDGIKVNLINLQALEITHVNQLVVDTLKCQFETAETLADLLFKKTGGNPFFLTQMLTSLYQKKLLSYNLDTGYWQWDIKLLEGLEITDNVVELMIDKIKTLSEATQNILKIAACIGNKFDLEILSLVNNKSYFATANELWEALQYGLILPLNDAYKFVLSEEPQALKSLEKRKLRVEYKFLHDRVQQAAYSLITDSTKKAIHLKVGQLLWEKANSHEREEKIFELVNHLNSGVELITSLSEKEKLAQLNLLAARKAKTATAYEAAVKYLTVGLELLVENSWHSHYELTLSLYLEAIEAEYLNTNFERSAVLSEIALQHTTNLLDQIKIYEVQIKFYMAQNEMSKAIDAGFAGLEVLGISLLSLPSDRTSLLRLPEIEELESSPIMTDPSQLAALQLLSNLASPIFVTKPHIFPQIILTQVNLCNQYGYSRLAAYVYALYGIILCGVFDDINTGYLSGQLALKLLHKFDAKEFKGKVYELFNAFIKPWKEHINKTLESLLEALESALETGDLEFVGSSALVYCTNIFLVGERLDTVQQKQTEYLNLLLTLKQEYPINYLKVLKQLTLNLLGQSQDKCLLIGDSFDEVTMLPSFIKSNNRILTFITYLAKTILLYIFKDYQQAAINADKAVEYAEAVKGWNIFAIHNFYYSLTLLALYPNAETSVQEGYLKRVEENQLQMQKWAEYAPSNYLHKYELVEAEKARVLGNILKAMENYDRAIEKARKEGYIQEEALANELAAEFYLALDRNKIAQLYMTEAYYGYNTWGAKAKVESLDLTYPGLISRQSIETTTRQLPNSTTSSTSHGNADVLDLTTIIKASQAVSGEIVLDKLIEQLLKIVMENAGACSSCLILEKEGLLQVEATATVDPYEVVWWSSTPITTIETDDRKFLLPVSVINYVARTQENVMMNDTTWQGNFANDPYIIQQKPKSLLCMPIVNQGKLIGILYLENNLISGAFTVERLEVLKLLSTQVAVSLKNALLYTNLENTTEDLRLAKVQLEYHNQNLETSVKQRTIELQEKNQQLKAQASELKKALHELKQTQTQLIQIEKMSSLGQLVAGIAHEINNPINFIYGNISHTKQYFQDLIKLLHLYEQQYPDATPEIQDELENIDLEYLMSDLPQMLNSMKIGAERIRQIVLSLRNFSRLDEANMKQVNIHEGIDSSLLLIQNRLKVKSDGTSIIEVIKEYGSLPLVECYAGQLNQVFMNLLVNSIDVLEEKRKQEKVQGNTSFSPVIRIHTSIIDANCIEIRIADNGFGMTEEVHQKIFDPFFTTKPVGAGTGMGLAISYQIIVEKHKGKLTCISVPGQGAEFIIQIPVVAFSPS